MHSKAIVLSRENFGESDRYVQFLTEHWGVITVLAKAARKSRRRYAGGLDLFCHDEISIRGEPQGRPYLNELMVLNSFSYLREDFEKLMHAGKLVQWVKKLANVATPIPEVYKLLGQTLTLIERATKLEQQALFVLSFKLKLLSVLGFRPRLEHCVHCSGSVAEMAHWDLRGGGLSCLSCYRGNPMDIESALTSDQCTYLGALEQQRLTQWDNFSLAPAAIHQLSFLVTQFASFHTHAHLPI